MGFKYSLLVQIQASVSDHPLDPERRHALSQTVSGTFIFMALVVQLEPIILRNY